MPSGRVVFHRRVRWFLVLLDLVIALVALSGVFSSDTDAPPNVLQRAVCTLCLGLLIALAVRVARLAVVLDDNGILVRNVLRDIKLDWRSISKVEPPPSYGTWRKAGILIHTVSGEVVSASAYVRGRLDGSTVGADVVAAIQGRLRHP